MDDTLALILFSGTDDRLHAAAMLAAGAAATGRPVHVLLEYWALDAFRTDRIGRDHGAAPEAGDDGRSSLAARRAEGEADWAGLFREAKQTGDVTIQACSQSMDLLRIRQDDLDPLVDGVEGMTAFMVAAGDGQIVFI